MYRKFSFLILKAVMSAGLATVPASAAKMVGSQSVEESDMIVVQVHCKALLLAQSPDVPNSTPPGWTASGGAAGPEAGAASGDPAGGSIPAPIAGEGGARGATVGAKDAPAVDLEAISFEDCKAAGLVN